MRVKVILVCEECLSRNYTTTKNPQKNVERIERKGTDETAVGRKGYRNPKSEKDN